MPIPPSRVCPLCGLQDDLGSATPLGDGSWQFVCTGHPEPYLFETASDGKVTPYPDGLAAELGLYEALLACLVPAEAPVEYGIVEHRYGMASPSEYELLVRTYGHVAQGPKKYTASAFMAATLGRMDRSGEVVKHSGEATGRWAYNSSISYWSLPLSPEEPHLTWERWARGEGIDPTTWPLLDGQ